MIGVVSFILALCCFVYRLIRERKKWTKNLPKLLFFSGYKQHGIVLNNKYMNIEIINNKHMSSIEHMTTIQQHQQHQQTTTLNKITQLRNIQYSIENSPSLHSTLFGTLLPDRNGMEAEEELQ